MKQPVDLFIVNKINYHLLVEESNFECNGGEVRLISSWEPNSNKSSLKAFNYKFCLDK